MKLLFKIGGLLMILGVVMFFFGISMFSHTGPLNQFISELGKYSFLFWLPTIFLGVALIGLQGILLILTKRNATKS
jgi:hypothetical protein